jgi:PAS domain S-box-containing protein
MRNTVRLILIVFLGLLILLNYNSIRILSVAIGFLNKDLDQRTNLIAREISNELNQRMGRFENNSKEIEEFFRSRIALYDLRGILLYGSDGKNEIMVGKNVPDGLVNFTNASPELLNKQESVRWKNNLIIPQTIKDGGQAKTLLMVFNLDEISKIENFTKIVGYINFLLIAFAAFMVFYFMEATFRPYRALMQTARSAQTHLDSTKNPNEADFLIGTFNGVISRLKEKEQELEKLHLAEKARADDFQQLNQDLIRSISSGLILIDQAGKIRVFNQAAESILKVSRSDALNDSYEAVIEKISPSFKKDIERCFADAGPVNRAEVEIQNEQGEVRFLGANIMPLQDRQQNSAGVFCIFTDITEFKLLQQSIALKEKFADLGEMAAGLAHEFRNSLTKISGNITALEEEIPSEQRKYIDSIQKQTQFLQKVVNDFLNYARPVDLELSSVNLTELLKDCIEETRLSPTPAVDLEMKGAFPTVHGDETMLRQVFTNLLRNAVESMDGSGKKGKIEVGGSISANRKFSIVEIRDNGTGIRTEDLPRIFAPFFSTKRKGIGIGLAMVQKLVLQHKGTITVESSPEGSVFRVQLPNE